MTCKDSQQPAAGVCLNITGRRRPAYRSTAWRGKHGIFGHAMDAKTSKPVIDLATGLPIATIINYMLPDGRDICPAQIRAGCKAPCLNTAGRGAMNSVQKSRAAKTARFRADPDLFLEQCIEEIEAFIRFCVRRHMVPAVRFNGTSDRPDFAASLAARFPSVIFYDYTKLTSWAERYAAGRWLPFNYHLTLSWSGASNRYREQVESVAGIWSELNLAVVFGSEMIRDSWIETGRLFLGRPVISGTAHDCRIPSIDGRGVIIGLVAKGKAKRDRSGFVTRRLPLFGDYPRPTVTAEPAPRLYRDEMEGVTYYA